MIKTGGGYTRSHTLEGLGYRPHRLTNSPEGRLFLLSSGSQDIYEIGLRADDEPRIVFTQKLEFLENTYTRSFMFYKGKVLFVRADGILISAKWENEKFVEETRVKLPDIFSDLNDVFVFNNKLVVSAGKAVGVAEDLASLTSIKNQIQNLGIEGRPYFMSEVDGNLYIPEIANRSRIQSYNVNGSTLTPSNTLFDFIGAIDASKTESARLPK